MSVVPGDMLTMQLARSLCEAIRAMGDAPGQPVDDLTRATLLTWLGHPMKVGGVFEI